jgi:hypothetical protein
MDRQSRKRGTPRQYREVPLGFFESNPHEQLLLGVRGSGLPELVLYEWKWESVENR